MLCKNGLFFCWDFVFVPRACTRSKRNRKKHGTLRPLRTIEAAERISRLISEIQKEGDEEAEQAELVDPTELEKIKTDAEEQKSAIDALYERKRTPVKRETSVVISKRRRRSRLQILAYQEKAFSEIITEAKERAARDAVIGARLDDILEDLLTQAICRMNEPHVFVHLRNQDLHLAKRIIAGATYRYYLMTGKPFKAELNRECSAEGEDVRVVISNRKGDIWVSTGLESRIELFAKEVLLLMGPKRIFGVT